MRELVRAWITVGTQSVGGGQSTLLLMRRLIVDRHAWLTPREFTEFWALSQLSPGIHIVALAGLIGRRIAGWRGVAVAVGGMMVPAATITTLMTAAYVAIGDHPIARGALAGMAPAAGGMTLALALVMAREVRRRGSAVIVDGVVAISAFAVLMFTSTSSIAVIAAAAACGTLFLRGERPTSERAPE